MFLELSLYSMRTVYPSCKLRPTLAAVRMLSPVMMRMLYLAFCRWWMCLAVSSLRGELQMKNPQNYRSFSQNYLSLSLLLIYL